MGVMCNRILCYLRCQEWEKAAQECRNVLDLDKSSIKGNCKSLFSLNISYFYSTSSIFSIVLIDFLGCALLELKNYDEAIVHLIKSQDLAREQHVFVGDEASSAIRAARKRRWAASEERSVAQEADLHAYLNKLVIDEKQTQVKELTESDSSKEIRNEGELEQIELKSNERLNQINTIFNQLDEHRRHRDVPESLCDRISFEVMRDPVITPSGITYDRKQV